MKHPGQILHEKQQEILLGYLIENENISIPQIIKKFKSEKSMKNHKGGMKTRDSWIYRFECLGFIAKNNKLVLK